MPLRGKGGFLEKKRTNKEKRIKHPLKNPFFFAPVFFFFPFRKGKKKKKGHQEKKEVKILIRKLFL
jgi:hypothetical protein